MSLVGAVGTPPDFRLSSLWQTTCFAQKTELQGAHRVIRLISTPATASHRRRQKNNKEEVAVKRISKFVPFILLIVAFAALPAVAGQMPSKTAANQSLDSRAADLALVRDVAANDQVAQVLASHGFSQEQVNQRLSQLSQQDLHNLAQNLQQVQAAGVTKQQWIWIGIGALAALILVVATHG